MPPVRSIVFGLFAEQISLFEAIHVLLIKHRHIEAIFLLDRLLKGTCLLQLLANAEDTDGLAIRIKLEAIERQLALFADDAAVVSRLNQKASELESFVKQRALKVPGPVPALDTSAFFGIHSQDIKFCEEVSRGDDLAVALPTERDEKGNQAIRTQIADTSMSVKTAGLAIAAMTSSTVAFAEAMGWPHDPTTAKDLDELSERLSDSPDDDESS
jgi:hypothetical protein